MSELFLFLNSYQNDLITKKTLESSIVFSVVDWKKVIETKERMGLACPCSKYHNSGVVCRKLNSIALDLHFLSFFLGYWHNHVTSFLIQVRKFLNYQKLHTMIFLTKCEFYLLA